MFEHAGSRIIQYWKDPESEYRLWLLEKPAFYFPLMPEVAKQLDPASHLDDLPMTSTASSSGAWPSTPSRQEWETLWKFWDLVTLDMIPEGMLHEKPIDLRHKCLFYLGHIPTFLDIHLTRALKGQHTEPEHFKDIFERGIDPHVEDPSKIHDHSAVPEKDEEWPILCEILDFRDRVRARLFALYDEIDNGGKVLTRRLGRILWMTFEHEAFHVEVGGSSTFVHFRVVLTVVPSRHFCTCYCSHRQHYRQPVSVIPIGLISLGNGTRTRLRIDYLHSPLQRLHWATMIAKQRTIFSSKTTPGWDMNLVGTTRIQEQQPRSSHSGSNRYLSQTAIITSFGRRLESRGYQAHGI